MNRRIAVLSLLLSLVLLAAIASIVIKVASDGPSEAPEGAASVPVGTVIPEQFGAVGDGHHDDTSAVQMALEVAAEGGARVLLREGSTYLCNEPLRLPSGSHVVGQGPTSVLRFTWTSPDAGGPYYLGNENQQTGDQNIVLDNFAIVGGGSGLPTGPRYSGPVDDVPGIRLRLLTNFRLTRLDVTRVAGISVLYQGCVGGVIADNYVHLAGRDGITGTSFTEGLKDIVLRDNRIEKMGDDGIAVISASVRHVTQSPIPSDIVIANNVIPAGRTTSTGSSWDGESWSQEPSGCASSRTWCPAPARMGFLSRRRPIQPASIRPRASHGAARTC